MTKDEALKLAKAWFERNTYGDEAVEVYEAIEQALAAFTVQEPVAIEVDVVEWVGGKLMATPKTTTTPPAVQPALVQEPEVRFKCTVIDEQHPNGTPLEQWGNSAQRQWVGLTPDDIRQLEKENTVGGLHGDYCPTWDLIESVEAKLRSKNNG
jgi:hypothetical protein